MSKRAFVPQRIKVPEAHPVRVAPKAPQALPDREPRNLWVIIGIFALIVGLIGIIVVMYVSGSRNLQNGFFPLIGIAGFMMLMFSGRFGRARKISWGEQEKNRRTYLRDLDNDREQIQTAVCEQRAAQEKVHSNPRGLGAIIGGSRMWERRRSDADFLDVRLGVGVQNAPDSVLSVTWPDIPVEEELDPVPGQALRDFILEQRKIRDIAKVLNLRSQPGFSFVSEDMERVRSLMRSVLCSLAVFHNPVDVKLMVVTRNPEVWSWMVWLPHNQHDELFDACGWRRLIFTTPGELEETLGAELHLGTRRRGPWKEPKVETPTTMSSPLETAGDGGGTDVGPHWVIVDDNTGSPEAWESVVGQVGKERITVLRVASRLGTGVGFGKGQVFELAERTNGTVVNGAAGNGAARHRAGSNGEVINGAVVNGAAVAETGGEHDDARPAPLLRIGGRFFAHADQLSAPRAYRYARAMARHSPTSSNDVTDAASGAAELQRALGIADPRELDVDRLWAERRGRGDERWAEIPVGAKPNGELQTIILRAKDFGGFGFHSVVIGTSGSGKSEFFLSLVYGLALTHSPETFNVIFVDMKFDSAAQDIHGLPHVVAALSNMGKDDRHLAERMRKAIEGEIKRRYELFESVGARDANDYEEIRLAGRDLEPVPILLVVIDEYLELFASQPKWIELIIHIGQVGRGANVFFMLGGQRLDLSSLNKVKSNIAFRIALRAESGDDSREVIQSDAAYHLPSKENGFALLKVGPRDLEPFRCFYLSAAFVVPKLGKLGKTVDMTLTRPRLYGWEYQPLDDEDAAALANAAAADEEPDEFLLHPDGFKKKKIVDVYRESLMAVPHRPPHTTWLSPLENPEPVDELVRLYRGGKPWHVDYGGNPGLVFPLGIMDIPEEAKQLVYSIDALRDNIMVVGAGQKGKTNTLMTLICSASLMYAPARVSFFCVGGAQLNQLASLPHVADVVSPSDREGVVSTVQMLEGLISAREDAFRRDSSDINDFRERRFGPGSDGLGGTDPNDRYGDVFLVVDDFADLYEKDTMLGERIIGLSGTGPQYGVHVVATAGGWIHGQRQKLVQNSNIKIQLRLAETNENQMANASLEGREAARNTLDRPGFGLTNSLHELLIGIPAMVDTADKMLDARDIGARVAAVAGMEEHATLMRLPERVALTKILEVDAEHRPQRDLSIAYAIGELHELKPVPVSLINHPGMMIMGRALCGKSWTLAAIGEAVMARFSPAEAQLTIIDPKTGPLSNLISQEYVRAYAYEQDEIDEVITHLAREILLPRRPPSGLSQQELRDLKPWEGPRHFVLIDDVQDLRPAVSYPGPPKDPVGAALWKLMESPRNIGLHVFTTRNGNWATMEMDPWVRYQRAAKVPTLYMDNDPINKITQTIRAQQLPPGRGLLVTGDAEVEGVLVGMPSSMTSNR